MAINKKQNQEYDSAFDYVTVFLSFVIIAVILLLFVVEIVYFPEKNIINANQTNETKVNEDDSLIKVNSTLFSKKYTLESDMDTYLFTYQASKYRPAVLHLDGDNYDQDEYEYFIESYEDFYNNLKNLDITGLADVAEDSFDREFFEKNNMLIYFSKVKFGYIPEIVKISFFGGKYYGINVYCLKDVGLVSETPKDRMSGCIVAIDKSVDMKIYSIKKIYSS